MLAVPMTQGRKAWARPTIRALRSLRPAVSPDGCCRARPVPGQEGSMQRTDHHNWTSEAYVDEWVRRQQADDPRRTERFQLMCDLLPFPDNATITILDVGA